VYRREVTVQADKPLENILKRALFQARRRLNECHLQRYYLKQVFKPGKELLIADIPAYLLNLFHRSKIVMYVQCDKNNI